MSRLLCIAVSLGACAVSLAEPPLDRENFDVDACESTHIGSLANITPGETVDFMEIRQQGLSTGRIGERCAGATEPEACEAAFAALGAPSGWDIRPSGGAPSPQAWIAYTRGDEVGVVGRLEIAEFLAPVDSVADAVFLAQIASLGTVQCGEDAVRALDDGYEVITQTSYVCGGGRDESRVEVLRDGATQIVERSVLDPGREEICP